MDENYLIDYLQKELTIEPLSNPSLNELKDKWSNYFNELIQLDFQKLIFILYRVDVSEKKFRQLLKEYPDENAGKIITELMIERLKIKFLTKQKYRSKNEPLSGDADMERW